MRTDDPRQKPDWPDTPNARDVARGVDARKRPVGLLVAAAIEAWTAGYAAVTAPNTLRNYRSLFAGFGAELSGATNTLLALPYVWYPFAFAGIALLVWIGVKSQPTDAERRRMKHALWIFAIAFGLTIAWAAYAIYMPLFRLGSVV